MSYEEIRVEIDQGVALVTMNRPDKLNAMTLRMGGEIRAAVQAASDDDAVRVIVLTGAGRGFCAGADVSRLAGRTEGVPDEEPLPNSGAIVGGLDLPAAFAAKYAYLATAPKPVIAAVNGAAAGVGLVLALFCDMRIAAAGAKLTSAFARRGLIAEYGVGWLLPRLIGPARAMDVLLSARVLRAEEALDLGLVNRVVPREALLDEVLDYARTMAREVSPRSLRVLKRQIWLGLCQGPDAAMALGDAEMATALESDDFREGIRAWTEGRAPAFTGR